jgi:phenylacetate-coenzyme A ligase PaaK-like adenylate-forming protein
MNSGAGVFDEIPSPPLYSQSIDFEQLYTEYSPAPQYFHTVHKMPARCNGEYFCVVDVVGEARRDEMTVKVAAGTGALDRAALQQDLERRFKEVLSVKVGVEVVDAQSLDRLTGLTSTSKIKRIADNRRPVK